MYMAYCLYCNKKAKKWSGHIHTNIGIIIIGFCEKHYALINDEDYDRLYKNPINNCKYKSGCYGFTNKKIKYTLLDNVYNRTKNFSNKKLILN